MSYNPEIMYNSAGMPVGSRSVSIYRITSAGSNATVTAGGTISAAGGTTLMGTYILENFSWKAGNKIDRNTAVGADLDFAILRQKITGTCTCQLSTSSTPIVGAGQDIFAISPGMEADGVTALPYQLFVIVDAAKDESEGNPQKQTLTLRFDRGNSDSYWKA